jgi:hypothetical protein
MFKNDVPERKEFYMETMVNYGMKKYFIITHSLKNRDYYDTVIYQKKFMRKEIDFRKKNKFKDFCYRSTTERQAKRTHLKVVNRFLLGKKEVEKLGNTNLV